MPDSILPRLAATAPVVAPEAARISDYTAFFYLGELIEHDVTTKLFTHPAHKQTEDYVTGRFG